MLLTSPKQQRTLSEIVASIPDSARVEAATRLARVGRLITRRHQQDSGLSRRFAADFKIGAWKNIARQN
jgi:hypothetical protein